MQVPASHHAGFPYAVLIDHLVVRPDGLDTADLALRQSYGAIEAVAIGRARAAERIADDPAFTAATANRFAVRGFNKIGRPYHVAGNAHASKGLRDRKTIA